MITNITTTTMPKATYGSRITAKSCNLISAFSASLSIGKRMLPAASLLSESRLGNTTIEATAMPASEPMGLKACERFKRRVAFSLEPSERMKGLAVVSRKAKPKVKI